MATITASLCVQCLGVCIDRHLDVKKQVSQTISACSFYLCNINQISRFLPRPTKERTVKAILTSRLDYCNALLYGTSAVNIARLQRIHNTAARLIMRCPRSVATVPHPCYANSTGCPLCAELISSYLYSLTKPCTTTRQCICVNSCARINRQEHCALRTIGRASLARENEAGGRRSIYSMLTYRTLFGNHEF